MSNSLERIWPLQRSALRRMMYPLLLEPLQPLLLVSQSRRDMPLFLSLLSMRFVSFFARKQNKTLKKQHQQLIFVCTFFSCCCFSSSSFSFFISLSCLFSSSVFFFVFLQYRKKSNKQKQRGHDRVISLTGSFSNKRKKMNVFLFYFHIETNDNDDTSLISCFMKKHTNAND